MMNKQLIYAVTLTLTFSACDFGRIYPPENPSLGTLSAKMNGKEWTKTYKHAYQTVQFFISPPSTAFPCEKDRLDLISNLYSSEGSLRRQLSFMKIPEATGKYPIINYSGECKENDPIYCKLYTIEQDGDVLADVYNTVKGSDSYLQIESYNKKTGEIRGNFKVTLFKEKWIDLPIVADTMKFTEGKFHTRILDLH